jgi:thiol-disulfide isomerase/thioredoxin
MVPLAWIILVVLLWVTVVGLIVLVLGVSQRLAAVEAAGPGGPPLAELAGGPAVGTSLGLLPAYQAVRNAVAEAPAVLLFLSPTCGPCRQIAREMDAAERPAGGPARIVVVTDEREPEAFQARGVVDTVVSDPETALQTALSIRATPFGIAVDGEGVVRRTAVMTKLDDVAELGSVAAGALRLTQVA